MIKQGGAKKIFLFSTTMRLGRTRQTLQNLSTGLQLLMDLLADSSVYLKFWRNLFSATLGSLVRAQPSQFFPDELQKTVLLF